MLTVIVDYDSGNLHSAEKAFQRMARETDAGEVRVSSNPEEVAANTTIRRDLAGSAARSYISSLPTKP